MLTADQRQFLLSLAREIISSQFKEKPLELDVLSLDTELCEEKGVFLTLTKEEDLRGQIGNLIPVHPLYRGVMENAKSAAFSDPRFFPVTEDELDGLHIKISVLTNPEKLLYESSEDLLRKLIPNHHGVILTKGYYSATYLPQVWEQIPEKEEFLSSLCEKAGMPRDEWKKGDIEVQVYEVESFEEE